MQGQGNEAAVVEVRNIPQYLNQDEFSRLFGQLHGCQSCAIRVIGGEPVGLVTFLNASYASAACQAYNGWQGWGPKGLSVEIQQSGYQPAHQVAASRAPAYPNRPPLKRELDPMSQAMGNSPNQKHHRTSFSSQSAPPPQNYPRPGGGPAGQAVPSGQVPLSRPYGQPDPNVNPMQYQQPPQQYAPAPYEPQPQQQQQPLGQPYQQPPQQQYMYTPNEPIGRADPRLGAVEPRSGVPPLAPPNPGLPGPGVPPPGMAAGMGQQQHPMMGGGMMQQASPRMDESPLGGQQGIAAFGVRYGGGPGGGMSTMPPVQEYKPTAPGMDAGRGVYTQPPSQQQLDGRGERVGPMQAAGFSPMHPSGRRDGSYGGMGGTVEGNGEFGGPPHLQRRVGPPIAAQHATPPSPEQYVPEAKPRARELPRDACDTLFVEGLPPDISKREVSHIFRPFEGFATVRLISKGTVNEPTVLCFVRFDSASDAHVALTTLQGYPMDLETESTSLLKLSYARPRQERNRPDAHRGGRQGLSGGRGRAGEAQGRGMGRGGRASSNRKPLDGMGARAEGRPGSQFSPSLPSSMGRGRGGWVDERRPRGGFMPQGRGGFYMP